MAPDPAAILAEAKRTADALAFACRIPDKVPDFSACGGPAAEAYWSYFTPVRISSLLAAIERVLELADDLDAEAAQADTRAQRADERGADTACTVLYARATALNEGARRFRAAITAALTGPQPADPPQSEDERRAAAEALEALRTRLAGKGDGDG
jgi:hypothetical protein